MKAIVSQAQLNKKREVAEVRRNGAGESHVRKVQDCVASTTSDANPVANGGGGRPVDQDVLRVSGDMRFESKKSRLVCADVGCASVMVKFAIYKE
ncbi:hypothetical protein Pyn_33881 [Prunus yedoensis var. nudiflora]|uniref:Uncharacterized protein n=1 Tax=Prunus yedoensis var. nudiflora TaxID=2094558 RepID=A0A314YEK0_PRUYE|nr:hypothetical protein Pyn_33881 [Prunus yedoensis var. nudiflora]